MQSIRTPSRTRGAISASLEGSPPRPSTAPHVSASLEAIHRRKGQMAIHSPARRTEALNSHDSTVAPGSDGVRPPLRTVAVTGVLSTNSGHCSAIPGTVTPLWEPATHCANVRGAAPAAVLPTHHPSLVLSPPQNPRTAWARPSEAAPTLTRAGPPPAEPSERRHVERGGRYSPQGPPRHPLELPGRLRDLRRAKDDAQDDCHARRHTPQCTFHSA